MRFCESREAMNLEDKVLPIPVSPAAHKRVRAPVPSDWMLGGRCLFIFDGSECNKIGVSHRGFDSQGSRCVMSRNSRTGNQIEDYRAIDLNRGSRGQVGSYMSTYVGNSALYKAEAADVSTTRPALQTSSRDGAAQRRTSPTVRRAFRLRC